MEAGTSTTTTLYLGPVEIRNYGAGAAEEILLYPHPKIRITKTKSGSTVTTKVNTLLADGLGSIRAVTDAAGLKAETSTYRPFGEEGEGVHGLGTPKETKGFIPFSRFGGPKRCHGNGRTFRRRRGPAIPQRKVLRPEAGDVPPARLVGGDAGRGGHQPVCV